ncbi:MAG: hypothetical protein VKJ04_05795 [Vampirovibrionales bacterium]|nr:hypothetical protein [Vampirovibrionales bacterium]
MPSEVFLDTLFRITYFGYICSNGFYMTSILFGNAVATALFARTQTILPQDSKLSAFVGIQERQDRFDRVSSQPYFGQVWLVPESNPKVQKLIKEHRKHLGEPKPDEVLSYRKQVMAEMKRRSGDKGGGKEPPPIGRGVEKRKRGSK